jgi:hypothetical protein
MGRIAAETADIEAAPGRRVLVSSGAGTKLGQLPISSDHFFIFLSVLTTSAPEMPDFCGQK